MTTLFIASSSVPTAVTITFCILLAGLIACLALEEQLHAKKSIIAGAFAVICLLLGTALGILPFDDVVVGSKEAQSKATLNSRSRKMQHRNSIRRMHTATKIRIIPKIPRQMLVQANMHRIFISAGMKSACQFTYPESIGV